MNDSFLIPALTTLGYSLPELLACGIALTMLWSAARPGKPRVLGLTGVAAMLVCALMQLSLGMYQAWAINTASAAATDLNRMFMTLGIVRMLIGCVSLAGLILIVWGLCSATRPALSAPHGTG
jgi:TRAP-type C4-dicarboxylate transport system permease small subunit